MPRERDFMGDNRDSLFSLILREIDNSIDSITTSGVRGSMKQTACTQLLRSVITLRDDLTRMNADEGHIHQVHLRAKRINKLMSECPPSSPEELERNEEAVEGAMELYRQYESMLEYALSNKQ